MVGNGAHINNVNRLKIAGWMWGLRRAACVMYHFNNILTLFYNLLPYYIMRKTKTIFARAAMTLLLAVLSSSGAWAQEAGMSVWLTDGSKTEVLISDLPEITYEDGNVTLKSKQTELSWPIAELKRLTFENLQEDTAIKAPDLDIRSDKLAVYDLNGRLIKQRVKSLSELPKGTYIVKDGSVTIKVMRK